jgi:flagellar motor switch protein FliM
MPQEALSQDDIDRLLRGMTNNSTSVPDVDVPAATAGDQLAPSALASTSPPSSRRIRNYDFRRPNRISKEHMRSLRLVHENFAREIPRNWGPLLRAGGQVKIASMEQTIYEEFKNHLAPHCFICTATQPPLEGEILFEIDLDGAFIFVDRLLGGPGTGLKRSRELTPLELSILQRVIATLIPPWREAWLPVMYLEPTLNRVLASTEFLQLTTINESVLVTTFIAHYLGVEIEMITCIPYSVIEPLMGRLVATTNSGIAFNNDEVERARMTRHLRNTDVIVSARLGTAPVPIAELRRLAVGDVIRLDVATDGLATIHVGAKAYFTARPGISNGSMAVQVDDTIRPKL